MVMARPEKIVEFGALPRDPDRDAALVDLRPATRTRADIVLSSELGRKLDRIAAEFRCLDDLARRGLPGKTRLLFIGPPGCGKTLCAEVLAAELGLPLLYARFDGIVSSYLGETATNLRRVLQFAGRRPSILFFDEFDVLGKDRDDPQEVGELKRVVGTFLQLLDSHPRESLVVAATNHHGLLDEALWRRFDEVLSFEKPSVEQLEQLLELRLRAVRKPGVDIPGLAARMAGFTFADAEKVCFEATKAMILGQKKELTPDLVDAELVEHRGRIALSGHRTEP
jgi:SpoVK/Ycf46/Vps4 family AAA+-type ATPase